MNPGCGAERHIWSVRWLCEVLAVSRSIFNARTSAARQPPARSRRRISSRRSRQASWRMTEAMGLAASGALFSGRGWSVGCAPVGTPDAGQCHEGAVPTRRQVERRRRTAGECGQYLGSGFRGRSAEPEVTIDFTSIWIAEGRRGKIDTLLHHPDRGSQCTGEQFQRLLAGNRITCSMSRAGDVWEGSAVEGLLSTP